MLTWGSGNPYSGESESRASCCCFASQAGFLED
jgi:hypothetical protein